MLERRMRVIRNMYSKKRGTLNTNSTGAVKSTYSNGVAKKERS